MTPEMAMNNLIMPPLHQSNSPQNTTVYLQNCFVWLDLPRGYDNRNIIHVPEVTVLIQKSFEERQKAKALLQHNFKQELEDDTLKNLRDEEDTQVMVNNMGVLVQGVSLHVVSMEDAPHWTQDIARGVPITSTNQKYMARQIMSPVNKIEYVIETLQLKDRFSEVNFQNGKVTISPIYMMITTYDLHLFTKNQEFMNRQFWKEMNITTNYEEDVKKVIDDCIEVNWLKNLKKSSKKKLMITFGGLHLQLLDDVFNTNQDIMRLRLHPLTTTQYQGGKGNGMTKFYANLEATYFNYMCESWEPILENFRVAISMHNSEKTGSVTEVELIDEKACINLSTQLITILQGINSQRTFRTEFYKNKLKTDQNERSLYAVAKMMSKKNPKGKARNNINLIGQLLNTQNKRKLMTKFDKLTAIKENNTQEDMLSNKNVIQGGNFINQLVQQGGVLSNSAMYKSSIDQTKEIQRNGGLSMRKSPLDYDFIANNFLDDGHQNDQSHSSGQGSVIGDEMSDSEVAVPFQNQQTFGYASGLESKDKRRIQYKMRKQLTFSRVGGNILQQRFQENCYENLPEKVEIQKMLALAQRLTVNEIDLRECPYQIENHTGEDILLTMVFQDCCGYTCIPNLKLSHVPFPKEQVLEILKNKEKITTLFSFYLIEKETFNLKLFYRTPDLDTDICTFIAVPKLSDEVTKYDQPLKIHINSSQKLLKRNITLSSPVVVKNELEQTIEIKIQDRMNSYNKDDWTYRSFEIAETHTKPIPYTAIHKRISITDIDALDLGLKPSSENLLDLSRMDVGTVKSLEIREGCFINIFTETDKNQHVKNLTIVPPLIVNNLMLSPIKFYVIKTSLDRVFGERHKLAVGRKDYEIYEKIFPNYQEADQLKDEGTKSKASQLKIRVGICEMKSKIINLNISSDSEPIKKDFSLYKKGVKLVNISLLGRLKNGSYIIDTFMEAVLVDQLFLPLKYSQNIGTTEERMYPINTQEDNIDELEDNQEQADNSMVKVKANLNQSLYSMVSIPFKTRLTEKYKEEEDQKNDRKEVIIVDKRMRNKVFFLQENEPIFIADLKYIYQCTEVQTQIDGCKDYRLFYFDKQTNRGEYYDITATVEDFTFGKYP